MATRFYDGESILVIAMNVWDGAGYTPDWSQDFFTPVQRDYCDALEAYKVEDTTYLVSQAMDWANGEGDFAEDADLDAVINDDRNVDVEQYPLPDWLRFEATPDGNILVGWNENMKVTACIEVPEGASEDYGYLTLKKAIQKNIPGYEPEWWYSHESEAHLTPDASAGDVDEVEIEIDSAGVSLWHW